MSASTWPGPTEGSWSTSPTISSAAPSGTAASSARISRTSTIDVSSTTSRRQSSGLSASRLNPPVLGSTSSRRWIVLASNPVASLIRLAARPVGAHSRISTPLADRMRSIASTIVVFTARLRPGSRWRRISSISAMAMPASCRARNGSPAPTARSWPRSPTSTSRAARRRSEIRIRSCICAVDVIDDSSSTSTEPSCSRLAFAIFPALPRSP